MPERILSEVAAIALMLSIAGCGGSHEGEAGLQPGHSGGTRINASDPRAFFVGDEPGQRPMGDQSVFADIDVKLGVTALDFNEFEAPEYKRGEVAQPPIRLGMLSSVEINGGAAEARVPGLQVFANGVEAPEVGNAASPQQFAFQHQLRDPVRGQRTLMEIRYRGSTFSVGAVPLDVEITSPKADETVSVGEALTIRWMGVDDKPVDLFVGDGLGSDCVSTWQTVSLGTREASVAHPGATNAGKTCATELSVDWVIFGDQLPGTPFRSFRVQRIVRRIHRFSTR